MPVSARRQGTCPAHALRTGHVRSRSTAPPGMPIFRRRQWALPRYAHRPRPAPGMLLRSKGLRRPRCRLVRPWEEALGRPRVRRVPGHSPERAGLGGAELRHQLSPPGRVLGPGTGHAHCQCDGVFECWMAGRACPAPGQGVDMSVLYRAAAMDMPVSGGGERAHPVYVHSCRGALGMSAGTAGATTTARHKKRRAGPWRSGPASGQVRGVSWSPGIRSRRRGSHCG